MNREVDAEFSAYVALRSAALMRFAYLLTGNKADAEDLLQTALAKVYVAFGRIKERGAIDAYVRRTIVTTQTSRWRRRGPRHEVSVSELPATGHDLRPGPDVADTIALRDALWRALDQLGRRQRAVVVLRYYEDLSEADTAAALGISVGTVKSQAARALSALRAESGLDGGHRTTTQEVSP